MFSVNFLFLEFPELSYGVADDMLPATSDAMDVKSMKVINQVEFSQFIREFRQSMGLTQEQFAAFLGVTYPTINRWENGRTTPSPMALKLIEQKLNEISDRTSHLPQLYIRES